MTTGSVTTRRPRAGAALAAGLLLAPAAGAQVLFNEDFEQGNNPFGFDAYLDGPAVRGEIATGGPRGRVWMTVFQPGTPEDDGFGHRLRWKPQWPATDTLYWAGYVRFGYQDGKPLWTSSGQIPYQLRLPEFGREGPGHVFGRFRRYGVNGRQGSFELVTADGRVHTSEALQAEPLVSNRWYLLQFALEDRGRSDRVRIWIDNDREAAPDYEYVGGDMVDARAWQPGLTIDHGRRLHQVPADTRLYYDQITLATQFIDLPLPEAIPPAAPANLRIDDERVCPDGTRPVLDPLAPGRFRCTQIGLPPVLPQAGGEQPPG